MELSVACTFGAGFLEKISEFKEVTEVYGKPGSELIGGGRCSNTLRTVSGSYLQNYISKAHSLGIKFNYLLNGATLNGIEQTISGRKKIFRLLDKVSAYGTDEVTVSLPFLCTIIKKHYPHLAVKIGVFARVAHPLSARQWEELGADTICVSAIACNRDFEMLENIRAAVKCKLQLIANGICIPHCSHELTHMHLLTSGSHKNNPLKGFSFDYCILHCTLQRFKDPKLFINSIWIRPEDLNFYEKIGYTSFKIIDRGCPDDLLLRRVKAYISRRFDGNLYELIAPSALVSLKKAPGILHQVKLYADMIKPQHASIRHLLKYKKYIDQTLQTDFSETSPVYIDNRKLDNFLDPVRKGICSNSRCSTCSHCNNTVRSAVRIDTRSISKIAGLGKSVQDYFFSSV